MINVKLLFSVCFGALFFLSACRTTPQEPTINILRLATIEKLPANLIPISVAHYIEGALPFPADRLMLFVRKNLPAGTVPKLYFSDDDSIITEYNRYAAEKIFSGAEFDPLQERQNFLTQKAGNASKVLMKYFRIVERRTLSSCSYAMLENRQANALDFYHTDSLLEPEKILKAGLERKVYSQKEVDVVRKELKFYQKCKKNISKILQKEVPTVVAGDSKWHYLNFRSGKPADLSAVFRVDASPENDLIVRIVAEEPEMSKREITGTGRDYPNAWGDDCFEVFLIPNPEKPGEAVQFIITSGGVLFDTKYEKISPVHDLSWNMNGNCSVERKEKSWEITLTIPWKDLGYDKKPSTPFLMNVYRSRVINGKRPASYTWCPIKSGGNFQPKKFGYLTWEE